MNLNFTDKSLVIRFIQQNLKQTYNSRLHVTGDYYKHFEMNYGFAHFIAKYLDYTYPILDQHTKSDYANITSGSGARPLTECISLMNYFLCNNKGDRLPFNQNYYFTDQGAINFKAHQDTIYDDIYNNYMKIATFNYSDGTSITKPFEPGFVVENDLPLYVYKGENGYTINKNIIFQLAGWSIDKDFCEIDDFVASYLLGQTITPNSSMEDIYYVQKLMFSGDTIPRDHKGIWCVPGEEGAYFDLTSAIISYQKTKVSQIRTTPLFVTGYFDIFTEAEILKDVGETSHGILGL